MTDGITKIETPRSRARITLWSSAIAAGIAFCLAITGFVTVLIRIDDVISRVDHQIKISTCSAHVLDTIIAGIKADETATLEGKSPPPFSFPTACVG